MTPIVPMSRDSGSNAGKLPFSKEARLLPLHSPAPGKEGRLDGPVPRGYKQQGSGARTLSGDAPVLKVELHWEVVHSGAASERPPEQEHGVQFTAFSDLLSPRRARALQPAPPPSLGPAPRGELLFLHELGSGVRPTPPLFHDGPLGRGPGHGPGRIPGCQTDASRPLHRRQPGPPFNLQIPEFYKRLLAAAPRGPGRPLRPAAPGAAAAGGDLLLHLPHPELRHRRLPGAAPARTAFRHLRRLRLLFPAPRGRPHRTPEESPAPVPHPPGAGGGSGPSSSPSTPIPSRPGPWRTITSGTPGTGGGMSTISKPRA